LSAGVGVSDRKLGALFDAFSQVQEGQVTGTGLGLFGVRTRAEGLHGTCGARCNTTSCTGTGTVIWFAIPYVPDHHSRAMSLTPLATSAHVSAFAESVSLALSPKAKPSSRPTGDALSGGMSLRQSFTGLFYDQRLTAMVVDDTLTVRKLMEKLLLKLGFARVDCYENGSKGLDAMMEQQVDIVFSDVQMPIMTGPEVRTSLLEFDPVHAQLCSSVPIFRPICPSCTEFVASSLLRVQMVSRFRAWEEVVLQRGDRDRKQLIVAVTANGSQLAEAGASRGFDLICPKPLSVQDIQQVVQDHFC
jgi:CheY-like chemotaxis protein